MSISNEDGPGPMLLDIFIPYWGDPRLLLATVESVVAQPSEAWRLTVVDDAYPSEEPRRLLEALASDRVRYVRNGTNLGIVGNHQRCLDLAEGDLVMFLGCDDLVDPRFTDVIVGAASRSSAAMIQPGVRVIDEDGRVSRSITDLVKDRLAPRDAAPATLAGERLARSLLGGNWLYWPSLVFRTDAVRGMRFRSDLPIIFDLSLVLDLVDAGHELLVVPDTCFSYRRHAESLSSATISDGSRFRDDRRFFAERAAAARRKGWRLASRAARVRWSSRAHALSLLPRAVLRAQLGTAKHLVRHALRP